MQKFLPVSSPKSCLLSTLFLPLLAVGSQIQIASAQTLTTLVNFNMSNGTYPTNLVQGNDGNFYGTTSYGGTFDNGTVFKMIPSGTLTTLLNFDYTNGANPYGGLRQGSDGNFYGTTEHGGSSGDGTVFRMTPTGTITTLFNFTGPDGAYPDGTLVQGIDGYFYGTTSGGGSNSSPVCLSGGVRYCVQDNPHRLPHHPGQFQFHQWGNSPCGIGAGS